MEHIYLDYSATTPADPAVVEAMAPYWSGQFGNASSVHAFGRETRLALEESRERIASAIGAASNELFFTSGGTESDNAALVGVMRSAKASGKTGLVTTAMEHHAVLHTAERLKSEGFDVVFAGANADGTVDLQEVLDRTTDGTALVSVMHANNETGVLQPIEAIGRHARSKGALLHSDAVQTLGKIPIDVKTLSVDLLSFSAHKIHGPKGVGAMFIRKGTKIDPFLIGGAQESNRRAGTESVPLAVGFAKAVELALTSMEKETRRLRNIKNVLQAALLNAFPHISVNGATAESLPNILSVSFSSELFRLDGESLIMGMDLRGIAVTSGSACTSGSLQPSHVITAMGRDEQTARATIRFSFGRFTTVRDVEVAVSALQEVVRTAALR